MIQRIRHHLQVWRRFINVNLQRDLAYRPDFALQGLQAALWAAWYVYVLRVYFLHTRLLGGWTYHQALALLGVFQIAQGVSAAILTPNLGRIVEYVRKGTLDFVLLKPTSDQFQVSIQHFAVWRTVNVWVGLALIVASGVWGEPRGIVVGAAQLGLFIILLFAGLLILYSLVLMLMTLAFWFVRVENLLTLLQVIWETGRYPVSAYQGVVRLILTYVIPVAFITTVPASAIAGRLTASEAAGALGLGSAAFALSTLLWRRGIRAYTSASS